MQRQKFFGSNLYDLFGKDCDRLYKQWNVAIRHAFKVSNMTHRYLIETISNCLHIQTLLCSRFMKFHLTLQDCNKSAVRLLSSLNQNDLRTVYGRNLHNIGQACNISPCNLTTQIIKSDLKYSVIPDSEKWRASAVQELLDIRGNKIDLPGFSDYEVSTMLDIVCTI